jgi:dephospho-CoA kinase
MALDKYRAQAEKYKGVVISGIRSIGEVENIVAAGGTMIFVDAPVEIRYERMINRQRDSESQLSLEEFRAGEAAEMTAANTHDKTVQNLEAIRQMATVHLFNASDPATFLQHAVSMLNL